MKPVSPSQLKVVPFVCIATIESAWNRLQCRLSALCSSSRPTQSMTSSQIRTAKDVGYNLERILKFYDFRVFSKLRVLSMSSSRLTTRVGFDRVVMYPAQIDAVAQQKSNSRFRTRNSNFVMEVKSAAVRWGDQRLKRCGGGNRQEN